MVCRSLPNVPKESNLACFGPIWHTSYEARAEPVLSRMRCILVTHLFLQTWRPPFSENRFELSSYGLAKTSPHVQSLSCCKGFGGKMNTLLKLNYVVTTPFFLARVQADWQHCWLDCESERLLRLRLMKGLSLEQRNQSQCQSNYRTVDNRTSFSTTLFSFRSV